MALLIDTSVIIAVERQEGTLPALLDQLGAERVLISAMTASELLHGVHRAQGALHRGRRAKFVESILTAIPVLPFTLDIARVHSQIWADLVRRGAMIGAHDLIIAATALAHGLRLVTADPRDFGRVEGLALSLW